MHIYRSEQPPTETGHKLKHKGVWIVVIVIVLVAVALSILAYLYRPTTGIVTRVSATEITIRPNGSSVTKTFSITKMTEMDSEESSRTSIEPRPFKASDIHPGETVVVASSSNKQAQAIVIDSPR